MVERFLRPASPADAVRLRQETDGVFLAGGTELNFKGAAKARTVVSLDALGLAFVREEPGAVLLGPGTTLQEIADSPLLRSRGFGLLCDAALGVGSRAIRCQATLGGNVAANKSCSDLLPALVVLGAAARLLGPDGAREELVEKLVVTPDRRALITVLRLPRPAAGARFARQRFSRTINDLATVNVALGLRLDGATIAEPRLCVGGVAPTVVRLGGAEGVLAGASVADGAALGDGLARAVHAEVHPIDDVRGSGAFKAELAAELTRRALAGALAAEGGAR